MCSVVLAGFETAYAFLQFFNLVARGGELGVDSALDKDCEGDCKPEGDLGECERRYLGGSRGDAVLQRSDREEQKVEHSDRDEDQSGGPPENESEG